MHLAVRRTFLLGAYSLHVPHKPIITTPTKLRKSVRPKPDQLTRRLPSLDPRPFLMVMCKNGGGAVTIRNDLGLRLTASYGLGKNSNCCFSTSFHVCVFPTIQYTIQYLLCCDFQIFSRLVGNNFYKLPGMNIF